MARILLFAVFAAAALVLARGAWRAYRRPRESWTQGRGRWMVFGSARRGAKVPSEAEIRFWAIVWLVLAAAVVAVGLAIALAGEL